MNLNILFRIVQYPLIPSTHFIKKEEQAKPVPLYGAEKRI